MKKSLIFLTAVTAVSVAQAQVTVTSAGTNISASVELTNGLSASDTKATSSLGSADVDARINGYVSPQYYGAEIRAGAQLSAGANWLSISDYVSGDYLTGNVNVTASFTLQSLSDISFSLDRQSRVHLTLTNTGFSPNSFLLLDFTRSTTVFSSGLTNTSTDLLLDPGDYRIVLDINESAKGVKVGYDSHGPSTASADLRFTPVPEPATMLTVGAGLCALLRRRRTSRS